MFEYIGKIAGVEFVVVVHGRARQFTTASYRPTGTLMPQPWLEGVSIIYRALPALQLCRDGRRGARFQYSCGMKNPCRDRRAPQLAACRRKKPPSRRAKVPDWH